MKTSTRLLRAALVAPLVIAGTLAQPAAAQDSQQREPQITVSGEGEVAVAPDTAILSLAVLQEAETADAALAATSAAMREVMADLTKQGIQPNDIQTAQFQIQPKYRHPEPKDGISEPGEIVGYQVTNGLTVRVRELAKLGAILDRSVKLGINQGGQISFSNDNPEAALTEARKKAVVEALAKARTLTEAAGVKLGRILEINENSLRPMPQPMMRMSMAKDMASEAVPVATGENTYSVTVNVTFGLQQ